MERTTLFDDGNYRLDVELRDPARRIVVFFPDREAACPWAPGGAARRDTGADFAERYGLNVAIVGIAEADWFQGEGFPRLLGALERMCACFGHVTFIGSSMGAYGAIAAASAVAADHVIAFSPVSDIDPAGWPADPRHDRDFDRIGRIQPVTRHLAGRYTVVYDPADIDRRHVEAFAFPQDRLRAIPMVGAGHATKRVVKEAGLLSRLTRELMAEGGPDAASMIDLKAARRETPSWLLNMFCMNLHRRPEVAGWALDRLRETGAFSNRYARLERRLNRVRTDRSRLNGTPAPRGRAPMLADYLPGGMAEHMTGHGAQAAA